MLVSIQQIYHFYVFLLTRKFWTLDDAVIAGAIIGGQMPFIAQFEVLSEGSAALSSMEEEITDIYIKKTNIYMELPEEDGYDSVWRLVGRSGSSAVFEAMVIVMERHLNFTGFYKGILSTPLSRGLPFLGWLLNRKGLNPTAALNNFASLAVQFGKVDYFDSVAGNLSAPSSLSFFTKFPLEFAGKESDIVLLNHFGEAEAEGFLAMVPYLTQRGVSFAKKDFLLWVNRIFMCLNLEVVELALQYITIQDLFGSHIVALTAFSDQASWKPLDPLRFFLYFQFLARHNPSELYKIKMSDFLSAFAFSTFLGADSFKGNISHFVSLLEDLMRGGQRLPNDFLSQLRVAHSISPIAYRMKGNPVDFAPLLRFLVSNYEGLCSNVVLFPDYFLEVLLANLSTRKVTKDHFKILSDFLGRFPDVDPLKSIVSVPRLQKHQPRILRYLAAAKGNYSGKTT